MDAAQQAWVDPENKPARATVESRLATRDMRVEIMMICAKQVYVASCSAGH